MFTNVTNVYEWNWWLYDPVSALDVASIEYFKEKKKKKIESIFLCGKLTKLFTEL